MSNCPFGDVAVRVDGDPEASRRCNDAHDDVYTAGCLNPADLDDSEVCTFGPPKATKTAVVVG